MGYESALSGLCLERSEFYSLGKVLKRLSVQSITTCIIGEFSLCAFEQSIIEFSENKV